MCQPLSSFLYCLQLHKCIICYFHDLKSILNDHSFKKYISPVIFIDLKYAIIKNVYLSQLVALEIYAIMKTVYCSNWLPCSSN